MTVRNLHKLFHPTSIAVIGASAKPGTLGNVVFENIRTAGFKGPVYPVNVHGGDIAGAPVYASISQLPESPDLSVIVTPPDTVAGIIAELGARGSTAGVVLTAGFGEGGAAEGARRRDAVLAAARPNLFRIIGPNCLGIMVPGAGLNASFVRTAPLPGNLALVAQSGAIASALLDWAGPGAIGFSHVVTLGDMLDVDFGDMLDYLCGDENTRAILLYVEGITHARKFMSAARRAARIKPVLVIKGGRYAQSAKVAASHTGALAGSDAVYDAVFARAGIMRVGDLDDLFSAAEMLALGAPVTGDRLAIVTNGGGLGVLAADNILTDHGHLADPSPDTLARLNAVLPPTWSHGNPIDLIGDADARRYADAMTILLGAPEVDAVLVMYCPTSASDPMAIARVVVAKAAEVPHRPVLTAWAGEASVATARALFAEKGLPSFATPRDAVGGFMQLVRYRRLQDLLLETPPATQQVGTPHVVEAREIIRKAKTPGWLSSVDVKRLLTLYGIPVNRTEIVATPAEAEQRARTWGCRVALKIASPDIIHKSDVGGVLLDVAPEAAAASAAGLLAEVRCRRPDARLDGIIVEEMIKRPAAHELFLGVTTDVTFGPVIVFGHGGTGVEVIDDKVCGLPPLNANLARAMVDATRIGKLLPGYRNRPAARMSAIIDALVGLSQMIADHPQIVDLDINPMLADEEGVIAVDARIKVDPAVTVSAMIITPYPRDLEMRLAQRDGSLFFVRPLLPQDAPMLEGLAHHLTPGDLRFRFFAPLQEVNPKFAARLAQIDYDREMALLATRAETSDEALAVARYHADPDGIEAEFAVAVRSDQQKAGIGFSLMTYLIKTAKGRGIKRLWGDVLSDNEAMLTLARVLGMRFDSSDGHGVTRVTLDLA